MRSQPQLFETLSTPERRDLLTEQGPVHAWSYVATRTLDGMRVPIHRNLEQIPQFTTWSAHSKIYIATRQDIVSTVVLYNAKEVGGLTTKQLADYATMRSLAADYSVHPHGSATILKLFDNSAAQPDELTETDLAFLRSLYSGIPNLPADAKNKSMEQELRVQGGD